MDYAAAPVVPADAECVEVGDRCRTRPKRSGLGEGSGAGGGGVAMDFVLAEDLP
jgi:hypothetical protein